MLVIERYKGNRRLFSVREKAQEEDSLSAFAARDPIYRKIHTNLLAQHRSKLSELPKLPRLPKFPNFPNSWYPYGVEWYVFEFTAELFFLYIIQCHCIRTTNMCLSLFFQQDVPKAKKLLATQIGFLRGW